MSRNPAVQTYPKAHRMPLRQEWGSVDGSLLHRAGETASLLSPRPERTDEVDCTPPFRGYFTGHFNWTYGRLHQFDKCPAEGRIARGPDLG